MSRYDVANLKVRLGEYKIKTSGETKTWESKAARVVRHKEFSQNTLVNFTNFFVAYHCIARFTGLSLLNT